MLAAYAGGDREIVTGYFPDALCGKRRDQELRRPRLAETSRSRLPAPASALKKAERDSGACAASIAPRHRVRNVPPPALQKAPHDASIGDADGCAATAVRDERGGLTNVDGNGAEPARLQGHAPGAHRGLGEAGPAFLAVPRRKIRPVPDCKRAW